MKNLAVYWSRKKYFRPFLIISCFLILFGSTFIPLHSITKNGAFLLSITFPVIAGWLLGLRLGLLFWFLHSLLLMFLAQAVGSGLDELISSGIFSYIVTLLLTCGVWRISDLTKKLTIELQERERIELELRQFQETLEKQVEERTESLARINNDPQKEILQKEKANYENQNLQTSLKRAEKMEAIGQLAGDVAHDFNNMLGVIIGYTELILAQMDPSQKFRAELIEIQKAARRSSDLTRQLLTFARKQTVAPRVLDLNQTIEGIFNMLRRLIG